MIFSNSKTKHITEHINNNKPERNYISKKNKINISHFTLLNSTQLNDDLEINKTLDYEKLLELLQEKIVLLVDYFHIIVFIWGVF